MVGNGEGYLKHIGTALPIFQVASCPKPNRLPEHISGSLLHHSNQAIADYI